MRTAPKDMDGKIQGGRGHLGDLSADGRIILKPILKETGCGGEDYIQLMDFCDLFNEPSGSITDGNFLVICFQRDPACIIESVNENGKYIIDHISKALAEHFRPLLFPLTVFCFLSTLSW
jgi:hypothetical protein